MHLVHACIRNSIPCSKSVFVLFNQRDQQKKPFVPLRCQYEHVSFEFIISFWYRFYISVVAIFSISISEVDFHPVPCSIFARISNSRFNFRIRMSCNTFPSVPYALSNSFSFAFLSLVQCPLCVSIAWSTQYLIVMCSPKHTLHHSSIPVSEPLNFFSPFLSWLRNMNILAFLPLSLEFIKSFAVYSVGKWDISI